MDVGKDWMMKRKNESWSWLGTQETETVWGT